MKTPKSLPLVDLNDFIVEPETPKKRAPGGGRKKKPAGEKAVKFCSTCDPEMLKDLREHYGSIPDVLRFAHSQIPKS